MDHGMMAAKKFEEEGKPVAEASEIFKSVPLPWPCNAEDIEEAAAVASSSSWIWSGAAEMEGHSGAQLLMGVFLEMIRDDTRFQCSENIHAATNITRNFIGSFVLLCFLRRGVELEWRGAEREREPAGRPVMVSADEVDVNSQCNGERRDGGADRTESFVRGGGGET